MYQNLFRRSCRNACGRLSGREKLIDEKGADCLCGENGSGLSGGERQRISVARALLRKTAALPVDEAAASLAAETSFEALDAILNTRVIIAHDPDEHILRRCTGLFALKNGGVSEQGTFGERMERKGCFYSLFPVTRRWFYGPGAALITKRQPFHRRLTVKRQPSVIFNQSSF